MRWWRFWWRRGPASTPRIRWFRCSFPSWSSPCSIPCCAGSRAWWTATSISQDYDPALCPGGSQPVSAQPCTPRQLRPWVPRAHRRPLGMRARRACCTAPKYADQLVDGRDAMAPGMQRCSPRSRRAPDCLALGVVTSRDHPRRSDHRPAVTGKRGNVAATFRSVARAKFCCRWCTSVKCAASCAFGAKRSGSEYSAEDFRLLMTLTRAVGVVFGERPAL